MSKPAPEKDGLRMKVAELPTRCGVYQFLDQNQKPLYIGKAKNLRSRVRQAAD